MRARPAFRHACGPARRSRTGPAFFEDGTGRTARSPPEPSRTPLRPRGLAVPLQETPYLRHAPLRRQHRRGARQHRPDTGRLDPVQQVQDLVARRRRLRGRPARARSQVSSARYSARFRVKCGSWSRVARSAWRAARDQSPSVDQHCASSISSSASRKNVIHSGSASDGPHPNAVCARPIARSQPVRSPSPARPPASRSASSASSRGEPSGCATRCPASAARTDSRGRPVSLARNDVLQNACASSPASPATRAVASASA